MKCPLFYAGELSYDAPAVWVYKCADCGLVIVRDEVYTPEDWKYVQLDPHEGIWGWLCPKCSSGETED